MCRTTKPVSQRNRSGISVIEVLTSIVVAMIGVFGVMILIPFAVKQSERALDRDEATVIGRNAFAQFEIGGFLKLIPDPLNPNTDPPPMVAKWMGDTGGGLSFVNPDPPGPMGHPVPYSIDPLGITEDTANRNPGYGLFPQDRNGLLPAGLKFNRVSLSDNSTPRQPFSAALARRMFRTTDDLQFGEALTDLGPPQQIFDFDANNNRLRRQTAGEMSWHSVVVPVKENASSSNDNGGWKYRMYVLVYKGRNTTTEDVGFAAPILAPQFQIGYAGGTVQIDTRTYDPTDFVGVRKDDWVMMINELPPPAEPGFNLQIAFYRVIGFDNYNYTLTLDGPDFSFYDPNNPSTPLTTYLVHLENVVTVYERTFNWEGNSSWNL